MGRDAGARKSEGIRQTIGRISFRRSAAERVAIARAVIQQPKVLLLDEPLGALDLKLRKEMQVELKNLHETLNMTFIYVTHDQGRGSDDVRYRRCYESG